MAHPNFDDNCTIANPPRLLDRVRDKLRVKHYSIRTEQTYLDWIKRYILFHGKQHPQEMGAAEVEAFLTHLAVAGKVALQRRIRLRVHYCFYIVRYWKSNCRGWIT
jgi:hypothetical protein